MSNRRRPKLQQPPTSVAAPHWHEQRDTNLCEDEGVVTQTCVVSDHHDDALMDQGHKATHDILIDGLGDRRRSGIWWTHHDGDEALRFIDELYPADDPNPRVLEVRNGSLEHLAAAEHAVFIVAWCIATAAEGEVVYG